MIISKEKCLEIIKKVELDSKWESRKFKKTISYQTTFFPIDIELETQFKDYCKNNLKLDVLDVNLNVLKYEVGDVFARHIDQDPNIEKNSDWLYNINFRLNDDYEGGEFYLNDELFHKPVGEVYHYKSTEYHEVKPITKGIRYSALFYVTFRNTKNEKSII